MNIAVIHKDKCSINKDSSMNKQSFIKKSRDSKKAQFASRDDTNKANENQNILNHKSKTLKLNLNEFLHHIKNNKQ